MFSVFSQDIISELIKFMNGDEFIKFCRSIGQCSYELIEKRMTQDFQNLIDWKFIKKALTYGYSIIDIYDLYRFMKDNVEDIEFVIVGMIPQYEYIYLEFIQEILKFKNPERYKWIGYISYYFFTKKSELRHRIVNYIIKLKFDDIVNILNSIPEISETKKFKVKLIVKLHMLSKDEPELKDKFIQLRNNYLETLSKEELYNIVKFNKLGKIVPELRNKFIQLKNEYLETLSKEEIYNFATS